ncbi:MAG TPA: hypothetical protein VFE61_24245 [Candidatus Sulfotelmatobacter sp.]|jgi:hypothetical protein|nr:hypothetical protein [Candidatus Sulfotelmatobacter sp.]
MENLGPAGEFLRISEHYRRMSDGDLLVLARQPSALTDVAQQALATEISQRRLKVPPEEVVEEPEEEPPEESLSLSTSELPTDPNEPGPYDEDRRLIDLCTVWSLADALQVQSLLDTAAIPFFMGNEKATGVDKVTSNFADGVVVRIMQIGFPWARSAMEHYEPKNDPTPRHVVEEISDAEVRCPKCHSTEVVFRDLIPDPTAPDTTFPKYQWTCDSCGHHWEDDGLAK